MPGNPPAGLCNRSLPPARLLQEAAATIVAEQQARLPDLRGVVVVLPHRHAASPFAAALHAAAGRQPLLLPRLFTLRDLAAAVPLEQPPFAEAVRLAELYAALRSRKWFPDNELWGVAGELVTLIDELTRHRITLPHTLAEFTRQLEAAYRTRGEALNFEARVVHELWHAASAGGDGRLDAESRYQLQLARIAREAALPLYALALPQLAPAEAAFLVEYAKRAPVTAFVAGDGEQGSCAALLRAVWPLPGEQAPALRERALGFAAAAPASPLAPRLRLFAAASLEQEAQAIDVAIREWLVAGKKNIAVVVLDRLVARRARALLERAGVMVEDEGGWAFSTTSASTVLGRWLDAVASDYYYQDLLDLLKSPFVLSDWPPARRKRAVHEFERAVRAKSVVQGLARYQSLPGDMADAQTAADVAQILGRLKQADEALGRQRRTLGEWLAAMLAGLRLLGAEGGLARDSAGSELLALIVRRAAELETSGVRFALREWRAWLNRELEGETYRDPTLSSPVVFTSLAQSRLRDFEGVIVAGADARHLPAHSRAGAFLNEPVRAELKLPTARERAEREREDLVLLLAAAPTVLVTWQAEKDAEPNLLSPFFARLQTFHELAYHDDLADRELVARIARARIVPEGSAAAALPQTAPPAPSATAALVPRKISASGYASLVACPYQFFARHVLRLNELDEVSEALEKRDFGLLVHDILARFHTRHPRVAGKDRAALAADLEAISEAVFAPALAINYLSRGWLVQWRVLIPHYLDWQAERECRGWRWHAGEDMRERAVTLEDGRQVVLRGRLDRVDTRDDGSMAVLDYKTQSERVLKEKLASAGEDVQLPCYLLLIDRPQAQAAYLSFDRNGVHEIALQEDAAALAEATLARLREMFDALYRRAQLRAQGVESVCAWCEMKGLCRRQYWERR
ncbi:MAG: PD-(D/E)XK nuclease family protein [Burkholderiales bacterium]